MLQRPCCLLLFGMMTIKSTPNSQVSLSQTQVVDSHYSVVSFYQITVLGWIKVKNEVHTVSVSLHYKVLFFFFRRKKLIEMVNSTWKFTSIRSNVYLFISHSTFCFFKTRNGSRQNFFLNMFYSNWKFPNIGRYFFCSFYCVYSSLCRYVEFILEFGFISHIC